MATARDREFRSTAVKLGVFGTIMVLVFAGLVIVFGQFRSGSSGDYSAIFTSASRLTSGSKVRIAGVEVGRVQSIEVTRDHRAKPTSCPPTCVR